MFVKLFGAKEVVSLFLRSVRVLEGRLVRHYVPLTSYLNRTLCV